MNAATSVGAESPGSEIVRIPAKIKIGSPTPTGGTEGVSSSADQDFRRTWQEFFSAAAQPVTAVAKDEDSFNDSESLDLQEGLEAEPGNVARTVSQPGSVDGQTARPASSKNVMPARPGAITRQSLQALVATSSQAGPRTEAKSASVVLHNGNAEALKAPVQKSTRPEAAQTIATNHEDPSSQSALNVEIVMRTNAVAPVPSANSEQLPKGHSLFNQPIESSEVTPAAPQTAVRVHPALAAAVNSQTTGGSLSQGWTSEGDISLDPSLSLTTVDTKPTVRARAGSVTPSVDAQVDDQAPPVAVQKVAEAANQGGTPTLQPELTLSNQGLRLSTADPGKQSKAAREQASFGHSPINLRSAAGAARSETHSEHSSAPVAGVAATTFVAQPAFVARPAVSPAGVSLPSPSPDRSIAIAAHRLDSAAEPSSAIDATASQPASRWTVTGAHRVEAGFDDPSLGWVAVRAQSSAGTIHAAVVPSSVEAAEVLGGHLVGLNAHMATERIPMSEVSLSAPDGGNAQSAAQGNGQGHEQGGRKDPQQSQAAERGSLLHLPQNLPVTESASSMTPITNISMHEAQYVSVRV
jgi:hypothetical protein